MLGLILLACCRVATFQHASHLQLRPAATMTAQHSHSLSLSFQVTVDLTEAQIQDLLYLRRLFCGKIGQLSRSRKELMSKLPSDSIGICHASDKLEEVTNLAEQLRANGSEEYRTYMQFASSFYRGVSLPCSI